MRQTGVSVTRSPAGGKRTVQALYAVSAGVIFCVSRCIWQLNTTIWHVLWHLGQVREREVLKMNQLVPTASSCLLLTYQPAVVAVISNHDMYVCVLVLQEATWDSP